MPTYDYDCAACGATLEIFQSMTEAPKRKCPECGALKLKRRIGTGAGILFRGSGFYETDYRSDSYKQSAAADEPGSKADVKGSEGSNDAKAGEPSKAKPEQGGSSKRDSKGSTGGSSGSSKSD